MTDVKVNVLFNDALNTFYLRLYGVGHIVAKEENLLPPLHGLIFAISSKEYIFMHHPTYMIVHTTAFVTTVVKHWIEREIDQ